MKAHLAQPVTVAPMAPMEIFQPERDTEGGSGANFKVVAAE